MSRPFEQIHVGAGTDGPLFQLRAGLFERIQRTGKIRSATRRDRGGSSRQIVLLPKCDGGRAALDHHPLFLQLPIKILEQCFLGLFRVGSFETVAGSFEGQ